MTDYLSLETGRVITPGHATLGVGILMGPTNDDAIRPITTGGSTVRYRHGVGHSELSASLAYWNSKVGSLAAPNFGGLLGWKHALYLPVRFSTAILGRLGYSSVSGITGLLGVPLTWSLGPGDLTLEPAVWWQGQPLPFLGLGYQWNLSDQWQLHVAMQTYAQPFYRPAANLPSTTITTLPRLGLRYAPNHSLSFELGVGLGALEPEYVEQSVVSLGARYAF